MVGITPGAEYGVIEVAGIGTLSAADAARNGLFGAACGTSCFGPCIFCSETNVAPVLPGTGEATEEPPSPDENSSALFKKSSSGAGGAGSSFFSSMKDSEIAPSQGLPHDQQNFAFASNAALQYIHFFCFVPKSRLNRLVSLISEDPQRPQNCSVFPIFSPHLAQTLAITKHPAFLDIYPHSPYYSINSRNIQEI